MTAGGYTNLYNDSVYILHEKEIRESKDCVSFATRHPVGRTMQLAHLARNVIAPQYSDYSHLGGDWSCKQSTRCTGQWSAPEDTRVVQHNDISLIFLLQHFTRLYSTLKNALGEAEEDSHIEESLKTVVKGG